MIESWRPVVGFEEYYEVSSHGRVKSLPREARVGGGGVRKTVERIMRTKAYGKPGREYVYVGLRVRGDAVNRTIHSLVLEAFIGPRPPGQEACHNDGNSKNNMLENLRWDTSKGNNADKVRHGKLVGRPKQLDRTHCAEGHVLDRDDTGRIRPCRPCVNLREREAREQCPLCSRTYEGIMYRKNGSLLRRYCIPCLEERLARMRARNPRFKHG